MGSGGAKHSAEEDCDGDDVLEKAMRQAEEEHVLWQLSNTTTDTVVSSMFFFCLMLQV